MAAADSDEDLGHRFAPVTTTLTSELVETYRLATGHPDGPVPPAIASVYTYGVIAQSRTKSGAILARQAFRFHRGVRVGDVLRTEAVVTGRYEKRGRRYMEIETQTLDQDGNLVSDGTITRILPGAPAPAGAS